jgi:hypothetical protein
MNNLVFKQDREFDIIPIGRLAIDLNVFIAGKFRTDREAYEPLAKFWKTLHPDNVAGYDWGWDANHFERKP